MDDKEKTPQTPTGLEKLEKNIDSVLEGQKGITKKQADTEEVIKLLKEKIALLEGGEQTEKIKADIKLLTEAVDDLVKFKNTASVSFGKADGKKAVTEYAQKFEGKFTTFLAKVKEATATGRKDALMSGAEPGSFLVPEDFLPSLIDLLPLYPSFISQCKLVGWGRPGNTRRIPKLTGRCAVTITAEGAKKTLGNPTFDEVTQKLWKLTALCLTTEELVDDSAIDVVKLFTEIAYISIIQTLDKILFQGDTTSGTAGILTASGVLTPTVADYKGLAALKYAIPWQYRKTAKYYISTDIMTQIENTPVNELPAAYSYDANGNLKISGNEVEVLDPTMFAEKTAVFGDLNTVMYSPRKTWEVRFSNQAIVDDGTTEHNTFQENKEAYLFEARQDITVQGEVWSKKVFA